MITSPARRIVTLLLLALLVLGVELTTWAAGSPRPIPAAAQTSNLGAASTAQPCALRLTRE